MLATCSCHKMCLLATRAWASSVIGRRMNSSRPTVSTMTAHSLPVALQAAATFLRLCTWYSIGPHVRSTRTAVQPAFSSSVSAAVSRHGGPSVAITAHRSQMFLSYSCAALHLRASSFQRCCVAKLQYARKPAQRNRSCSTGVVHHSTDCSRRHIPVATQAVMLHNFC